MVKPEELKPTRAALFDDDGRSAYQPGRRRWERDLYGYSQTPNHLRASAAAVPGETPGERQRRVRRERRQRAKERAAAEGRPPDKNRRGVCQDCGGPCFSTARRCRDCYNLAEPVARTAGIPHDLAEQLSQPYRTRRRPASPPRPSPTHERNVARLEQLRLEFPL